jgi:hypothetical protein
LLNFFGCIADDVNFIIAQPVSAGDHGKMTGADIIHFNGGFNHLILAEQWIDRHAGVVMTGLGAECAVLRAFSGFGVDDGAGENILFFIG